MNGSQSALNKWLDTTSFKKPFTLTPLAGDASLRLYYRATNPETSFIVMDSSADLANFNHFISKAKTLQKNKIRVPNIFAHSLANGFALLEDFGNLLLLSAVTALPAPTPQGFDAKSINLSRSLESTVQPQEVGLRFEPEQVLSAFHLKSVDNIYIEAMQVLLQLQNIACPSSFESFNTDKILAELCLFEDWFIKKYLLMELTTDEKQLLRDTFYQLAMALTKQPQVFVHRDFHSRNIMLQQTKDNKMVLGVIDFQDAILGPFTYDLVSLLKDCYIQWDTKQINLWVTYFYEQLQNKHNYSLEEFKYAFDICGLQRHLKVLGIFCRLHFRDHKSKFLNDLPLVFDYTLSCLEHYSEFNKFTLWMKDKVQPQFNEKFA